MKVASLLFAYISSVHYSRVAAQDNWPAELVGTWSSKSNQTLTGPGFYDPVKDELTEPSLTGISYSFTADGYYETAQYRAVSNPSDPTCPTGILQFQHGSWTLNPNGSLSLIPIAVDGRQLVSTPCSASHATYLRYNQSELFKTYQVYTDGYTQLTRLDLFGWDGTPVNPLFLAVAEPVMVGTGTLNPTGSATSKVAARAVETGSGSGRMGRKRDARERQGERVLGKRGLKRRMLRRTLDPDTWWWSGVVLTGLGGVLYFGSRRLGIRC